MIYLNIKSWHKVDTFKTKDSLTILNIYYIGNNLNTLNIWCKLIELNLTLIERFPHCLKFLELLQEEQFRKSLVNAQFKEFLHEQQFFHWQFYRNNRLYPKEEKKEEK